MTATWESTIAWAYVLFGVIVLFWIVCYLLQQWRLRCESAVEDVISPERICKPCLRHTDTENPEDDEKKRGYHETHLSLRRGK